jgi:hypothetical protein
MPWLGNETLASDFASAAANSLGTPNSSAFGNFGPDFVFAVYSDTGCGVICIRTKALIDGLFITPSPESADIRSYAILAPSAPAPVPAPLPLFGAAAAFSATKRLRIMSRRLHCSTTQIS